MKRLVSMLAVVLSCALSLTLVKQADAYTFTTLNVPGVKATVAFGINDTGNVVGYYVGYYLDGTGYHGFTYDGSIYSTLDVPWATATLAYGINDTGSVAGYYTDGTGGHGFTYDGSIYSTLNVPGATYATARGINDTGSVAGTYWDAGGPGGHGFIATAEVGAPTYRSQVPEPSTILLLGSGLAGFAGIGIMKRRKKVSYF